MIRCLAFAFFLMVALGLLAAPARADCTLTSNGQTRPPGTIVLETVNNIALYCDGTVWKPLAFAAGAGGGGSCFGTWTPRDSVRAWYDVAMSADGTKLIASAGAAAGKVYTSTDSGVIWTERDLGTVTGTFAVAISGDGSTLAAGIYNEYIYTSTNGGANWTQQTNSGMEPWNDLAISEDGSILAAAVATNGTEGIHVSTDSGVNWTAGAPAHDWTRVAASSDGTKLIAGTWSNAAPPYISTNTGSSWSQLTALPSSQDWGGVASSGDGTTLAAACSAAWNDPTCNLEISTDSGTIWTDAVAGPARWRSLDMSDDGTVIMGVASDNANSFPGSIFVSTDSGATWNAAGPLAMYRGIALSANGTKAVAVAENGNIYTSECMPGGGGGGGSDTTPDAFAFTDQAPVAFSTLIASDIVQITGIDAAAAASISGDGTPEYRTCSDVTCTAVIANWGSVAGTINNNEYVQVRLTSSASQSTVSTATLDVGGVTDGFGVTTNDTTPDPFSITDQTAVALSTLTTSNIVQITGLTATAAISVAGGGTPQFQVCSDASCTGVVVNWTATANTIANNQYVRTRLTSSASQSTLLTSTVTIGGVSDAFDVTTGDFTPTAYSFTMSLNQPGSTQVTSNIVQISGISGAAATSITGGTSPQYRTCSDASCTTEIQTWTSGAASIQNNQYLQLRVTTPASGTQTTTMTVGTGGTSTAIWYTSTNGKGYFVMSSSGSNGNFGGRAGADATCLTNLTAGSWLEKASATLDAAHVFSFLCDGTGCNNLQASTIYQFARSGSGTAGGAIFVTNASGRGPGNGTDWSGATLFNSSQDFWSGRGAGSSTLWPTTAGGSHCTNWSDGTITPSGVNGRSDRNDDGRWNDGSDSCDSSLRYVCFVNP